MGNTNPKSANAKLELNKEILLRKFKTGTTNKDQTSLNFLSNIHEEIIKHFKNDELLDNSQIQTYLNVISKMKLQSDHLNLAKSIKTSLQKIYNENEKSKTQNIESLGFSKNFHKMQHWKSTSSEKTLVVKMPYNSISDDESFNSDMLSGHNFIQGSPSPKTATQLSIPSREYDYKFSIISRNFKKNSQERIKGRSNGLRNYSHVNEMEDAHLADEMVTHAKEISRWMEINIKQGIHPSETVKRWPSQKNVLYTNNIENNQIRRDTSQILPSIIDNSLLDDTSSLASGASKHNLFSTLNLNSRNNRNGKLSNSSLSVKTNDSDIIDNSQKESDSRNVINCKSVSKKNSRKTKKYRKENDRNEEFRKLSGNKTERDLITHKSNSEMILRSNSRKHGYAKNMDKENMPYFLRKFSVTNSEKDKRSCSETTLHTDVIEDSQESISKSKHNNKALRSQKSHQKNRLQDTEKNNFTITKINENSECNLSEEIAYGSKVNNGIHTRTQNKSIKPTITVLLNNILTQINNHDHLQKRLTNIQVLCHLKAISKMNIQNPNDKVLAEKLKGHLRNIYNENKRVENSKCSNTLQKMENEFGTKRNKIPQNSFVKFEKRTDENKRYVSKEFDVFKNSNVQINKSNFNQGAREKGTEITKDLIEENNDICTNFNSEKKLSLSDNTNCNQNVFKRSNTGYLKQRQPLSDNEFLNQLEVKIIRHCENVEFLEIKEIENYLKTLSEMNLRKDVLKCRAQKIKLSLKKLICYNLAFKKSEEWKSLTDSIDSPEKFCQTNSPHIIFEPIEQNPVDPISEGKRESEQKKPSDFLNSANSDETSKLEIPVIENKLSNYFNNETVIRGSVPHKLKSNLDRNLVTIENEQTLNSEPQANLLVNVHNKESFNVTNSKAAVQKRLSNLNNKNKVSTAYEFPKRNFIQKSPPLKILKRTAKTGPLIKYNETNFSSICKQKCSNIQKQTKTLENVPLVQSSSLTNSEQTIILNEIEGKIIRHCESEEFLENKDIKTYLKTLSDMNLKKDNLKFRSEKIKESLKKISSYNLAFNKSEEWKSVTETTNSQEILNNQIESSDFITSVNSHEKYELGSRIKKDELHCIPENEKESFKSNMFSIRNTNQSSVPHNTHKINAKRNLLSNDNDRNMYSIPENSNKLSTHPLITVQNKQNMSTTNSKVAIQKTSSYPCNRYEVSNKKEFPQRNFIQKSQPGKTIKTTMKNGQLIKCNKTKFELINCMEKGANYKNQKSDILEVTDSEQKSDFHEILRKIISHCENEAILESEDRENCLKTDFLNSVYSDDNNLEFDSTLTEAIGNLFQKLIKEIKNLYDDIFSVMREEFEKVAGDVGKGLKTYAEVHEHLNIIEAKVDSNIDCLSKLLKTISFEDYIKPNITDQSLKEKVKTNLDNDEKRNGFEQIFLKIIEKLIQNELIPPQSLESKLNINIDKGEKRNGSVQIFSQTQDILNQKVKDERKNTSENSSDNKNTIKADLNSHINYSLNTNLNIETPDCFCCTTSEVKQHYVKNENCSPIRNVYNENSNRGDIFNTYFPISQNVEALGDMQKGHFQGVNFVSDDENKTNTNVGSPIGNCLDTKLDIEIPDSLCGTTSSISDISLKNKICTPISNVFNGSFNKNSTVVEVSNTSSFNDQNVKLRFDIQDNNLQTFSDKKQFSDDETKTNNSITSEVNNCLDTKLDIEIPDSFCDTTSSISDISLKNKICTPISNDFNTFTVVEVSNTSSNGQNVKQRFHIQDNIVQTFSVKKPFSDAETKTNNSITSEVSNCLDRQLDIEIPDSFCGTTSSISDISLKNKICTPISNVFNGSFNKNSTVVEVSNTSSFNDQNVKLRFDIQDNNLQTFSDKKQFSDDETKTNNSITSEVNNCLDTKLDIEIPDSFCDTTSSISDISLKNKICTPISNDFNTFTVVEVSNTSSNGQNVKQRFHIQDNIVQTFSVKKPFSDAETKTNNSITSEVSNCLDRQLDIEIPDSFCGTTSSISDISLKNKISTPIINDFNGIFNKNSTVVEVPNTSSFNGQNLKLRFDIQDNNLQIFCDERHFSDDETKTNNSSSTSEVHNYLDTKLDIEIPDSLCGTTSSISDNSLKNKISTPINNDFNGCFNKNSTVVEVLNTPSSSGHNVKLTFDIQDFCYRKQFSDDETKTNKIITSEVTNCLNTQLDIEVPDRFCGKTSSINEHSLKNEIFTPVSNGFDGSFNKYSTVLEVLDTSSISQNVKPTFDIQEDILQKFCNRKQKTNNSITSDVINSLDTKLDIEIPDSLCVSTSPVKEIFLKDDIRTSNRNDFGKSQRTIVEKMNVPCKNNENPNGIQTDKVHEVCDKIHSSVNANKTNIDVTSQHLNCLNTKLHISKVSSKDENFTKNEIIGKKIRLLHEDQKEQYQEHCDVTTYPQYKNCSDKIIKREIFAPKCEIDDMKLTDSQDQLVKMEQPGYVEIDKKDTIQKYKKMYHKLTSVIREVHKIAEDLENSFTYIKKNEDVKKDTENGKGNLMKFLKMVSFGNVINSERINYAMPELLKLSNSYNEKYSEKDIFETYSPQLSGLTAYFATLYTKQNDHQSNEDFLPEKNQTILKIWKDLK